jgi:Ni/Co efflux regulator RcnB
MFGTGVEFIVINKLTMKKILALMLAVAMGATAMAQEKVTKDEVKVKKTSTIPQKIHNTFSKHKHYSGTKVKHVKKVAKKTTT